MTADELDGLRARTEAECRLLEEALNRIDRRRAPWAHQPAGDPFDLSGYENTAVGNAKARCDFATRRRDWLRGRYDELTARAKRRSEASAARQAGLSRFEPDLDRLIEVNRTTPGAFAELLEQRVARREADRAAARERVAEELEQRSRSAVT